MFEGATISERVSEGMAVAAAKGVRFGAANEKYNRSHHVSKTSQSAATERTKGVATQVQGVINLMKANKIKLTYSNIAANINAVGNIPLPSGKLGEWKSSQVSRVVTRHNIQR